MIAMSGTNPFRRKDHLTQSQPNPQADRAELRFPPIDTGNITHHDRQSTSTVLNEV